MDESGYFNIGERNYMALRKIFWMNNVLIHLDGRRWQCEPNSLRRIVLREGLG